MIRVVTNFENFPARWTATGGAPGISVRARSVREFLAQSASPEAVLLVNCDPPLTEALATCFLLAPRRRRPIVAVDLVLRRPATLLGRLRRPLRRVVLGRVDHYIHYFRDLRGLEEVYGIGPGRSSYVPFKPNLRHRTPVSPTSDGEYILCIGRSLRDYDTFFAAAEQVPYRTAIAQPDLRQLRAHGARFTRSLDRLPENVEVLPDDGTAEGLARILSGAKIVVMPILRSSIVASGLSVCLNAMLMGKCVLSSAGPGMSDVFDGGEVATVPPEDPGALADKMRELWENDVLRREIAAAAHRRAVDLGGEPELYQRILDQMTAWLHRRR